MTENAWTRWPSREAPRPRGNVPAPAPARLDRPTPRAGPAPVERLQPAARRPLGALAAATESSSPLSSPGPSSRAPTSTGCCPSLGFMGVLLGIAVAAEATGFTGPALLIWCGCGVGALERLPLGAALPVTSVALASYSAVNNDVWLTTAATVAGMAPRRIRAAAGRGSAGQCAAAARPGGGPPARPRPSPPRWPSGPASAREIHDVLAHSLSAQLMHLEAARLLIENGADRDRILERVVAAREWPGTGSPRPGRRSPHLRGELTPLEDFLAELVSTADGAEVTVTGERRPLSAEASGRAAGRAEALTRRPQARPGAPKWPYGSPTASTK